MAKEELIAGFKNALDRGFSIEEAKNSFLNAGYSPQEVEEAAEMINNPDTLVYIDQPLSQATPEQQIAQEPQAKKPLSKKAIVVAIIISLLVLITLIMALIFRGKILPIIENLLG